MQILENARKSTSVQHTPGKRQRIDLLIDLQEKIQIGKGAGYQRWAKVFNLKQMAKVLLFLQENDIHDYEQLERLARKRQRRRIICFPTSNRKRHGCRRSGSCG